MENISRIKESCVGCRGCEQICPIKCISMKFNMEGFMYPLVNENECVDCGLCLKNCPMKNIDIHRNEPLEVYAFRNKNMLDIMKSASGGAADVATKIILEKGGVVFGASYNGDFQVHHICITSEKERKKLQSSKYVQSDLKDCYTIVKKNLNENKKVLFTGTPCQIAGLYSFLGKDDSNLITLDLICHGVPSPKFFSKYLEYQSRLFEEKIVDFNFRSKEKKGWGTQYLLKTKTKTKTKVLSLDKYGKHFMDSDCYRECCYQCIYSNTNRVADITVGDFWGIAKTSPNFYSSQGVSSIFINTKKGLKLFELMKQNAEIQSATLEEGMLKQGNLINPSKRPRKRDEFYIDIDEPNFIEKIRIGLQIKTRIKSLLPRKIMEIIKKI